MSTIPCPDCEGQLVFKPKAVAGQKVICPHCGSHLEVISVDPLEIDWEYDWTWEGDEEEGDDY